MFIRKNTFFTPMKKHLPSTLDKKPYIIFTNRNPLSCTWFYTIHKQIQESFCTFGIARHNIQIRYT